MLGRYVPFHQMRSVASPGTRVRTPQSRRTLVLVSARWDTTHNRGWEPIASSMLVEKKEAWLLERCRAVLRD